MSFSTNAQVLIGLVKSKGNDAFDAAVVVSPQIREAIVSIYKDTPEEMVLKIKAFVTTGLGGVLRLAGQSSAVRLKTEARDYIIKGLSKFKINLLFLSLILMRTLQKPL